MTVLVRNAGYEKMGYVDFLHAIGNVVKGKSVVHESIEDKFFGDIPWPTEIRNVRYTKMTWREGVPKFSKKRLYVRDNWKCAYCLGPAATIDHIFPKSFGGIHEWENSVAACKKCNGKKRNRTPEEAGMPLLFKPFIPQWDDVL